MKTVQLSDESDKYLEEKKKDERAKGNLCTKTKLVDIAIKRAYGKSAK